MRKPYERTIVLGAPRGVGIPALTAELSSVRLSASSGRSSARSIPSSTTNETASSSTGGKQGISTTRSNQSDMSFKGTSGDPIHIIANYVKVLTKPQWELFQYHVQFSPDVENKRFRREIIAQNRVKVVPLQRTFISFLCDRPL